MLKGKAEILCDDRIIVRNIKGGFKIYGTWSHGDVSEVSANSAPLSAIMFLEKVNENRFIVLEDKKEITGRILACLIRPFVTVDWWEKTLLLVVDKAVKAVPCYILKFDKSGKVVEMLRQYIEKDTVCSRREGGIDNGEKEMGEASIDSADKSRG